MKDALQVAFNYYYYRTFILAAIFGLGSINSLTG